MIHSIADLIGHKLMLAFEGHVPPPRILSWLGERSLGGFTLFRGLNVVEPAQVRALTAALQTAAAESGRPPLLIASDQEGGQLVALGDETTQFPGNMALGATGDPALAEQVGYAQGRELAAMGVNVNYAPVVDVNSNPANPNVGVRAFGDRPDCVAEMGAALIAGLQAAGVAAAAKHFPGNGDSSVDPHFGVPILPHDTARLNEVEFRPFRAAIDAGVRLLMTAHVGLPALTGRSNLPATLSRQIMHDLLRREMAFEGLLISDALDMKAITQGPGQIVDVIAAVRAGVDLLLLTAEPDVQEQVYAGLELAVGRDLIDESLLRQSAARVLALKRWLASQTQPDLSIVGCAQHRRLEAEVARRATTLVRNEAGLLPLRLSPDARLAIIMPQPKDLTPADTSSYVRPALADAVRAFHPRTDEFLTGHPPWAREIAALKENATGYDLLLVGTLSASFQSQQADLVNELLATGVPVVTVALRTPYDLAVYPAAATHLCTYSVQPASLAALAAALWGEVPFQGKLPVQIPGLYPAGHGLSG